MVTDNNYMSEMFEDIKSYFDNNTKIVYVPNNSNSLATLSSLFPDSWIPIHHLGHGELGAFYKDILEQLLEKLNKRDQCWINLSTVYNMLNYMMSSSNTFDPLPFNILINRLKHCKKKDNRSFVFILEKVDKNTFTNERKEEFKKMASDGGCAVYFILGCGGFDKVYSLEEIERR